MGLFQDISDHSTPGREETRVTITPRIRTAECAISDLSTASSNPEHEKPAFKLIVDPGPVEVKVFCSFWITGYTISKIFNFNALAGHDYEVTWTLGCMHLSETDSHKLVAERCVTDGRFDENSDP